MFGIKAIRLVNGTSSHSGRVEVFHNGQWGSVCDDGLDMNDAAVICRQLGMNSPSAYYTAGYYGIGTGPVWLSNLNCLGSETNLESCSHNPWGLQTCSHEEDSGVDCSAG